MHTKVSEDSAADGILLIRPKDGDFFVQSVSPVVRTWERLIGTLALTDIPVLLRGESGSGKEMVAMHIHQLSQRRDQEMMQEMTKVSCALLTTESFSSSFLDVPSGEDRRGAWSSTTVFFDEISELDPSCQLQLLRALPDGDAPPRARCLRGRVIASTNRNLEEEVRAGRFREDLYYRINGICLRLSPLRHRREDIPAFVDCFLRKYSAQFGRQQPSLSARALRTLLDYSWPGNIRELENTIRKIVVLGDEEVALADLCASPGEPRLADSAPGRISLKEAARAAARQAEQGLILKILARTRWNRKRAAQELKISYKALLYKLKQISLADSSDS